MGIRVFEKTMILHFECHIWIPKKRFWRYYSWKVDPKAQKTKNSENFYQIFAFLEKNYFSSKKHMLLVKLKTQLQQHLIQAVNILIGPRKFHVFQKSRKCRKKGEKTVKIFLKAFFVVAWRRTICYGWFFQDHTSDIIPCSW